MPQHFIRCQACGLPHPSEELTCPVHGTPILRGVSVPPPSSTRDPRGESFWPPASLRMPPIPSFDAEDSGEPPEPRPSRDAPLIGHLLHGRYRVVGVIARGGMGLVYEGIHVGLRRPVAIKTIQPRFARDKVAVTRFHNEATVVGRFGHPNIVEVYDLGVLDDGTPYLVMERLEGQTVTERMRKQRPLPMPLAVNIACQVLSALVVTHAEGILHLDLKPDNLWITGSDRRPKTVKVLDFGVARVISRDLVLDDAPDSVVAGTPVFMAPEQAQGSRDLDARADIYSLGMILYVMLSGRLPYKAPTAVALLKEMHEVTPTRPRMLRPELPRELDDITMRALSRNRDDRFPDATSMLRALEAISADTLESADAPRPQPKGSPTDGDSEKVEYFIRDSVLPPPPRG